MITISGQSSVVYMKILTRNPLPSLEKMGRDNNISFSQKK